MSKLNEYEIETLMDFMERGNFDFRGECDGIETRIEILQRCVAVVFEHTPLFKNAIVKETAKRHKERMAALDEFAKRFKKNE